MDVLLEYLHKLILAKLKSLMNKNATHDVLDNFLLLALFKAYCSYYVKREKIVGVAMLTSLLK